MRQGFLRLKTVGKSLCSLFLQQYHQRYIIIIIVTFFLNVQYQIDPAANSLLNVMCVLRPEVRYETRAAIGGFKNRTIRKTDVREDDLSRVSVRSTGGHSKRRSGFNQIGLMLLRGSNWARATRI